MKLAWGNACDTRADEAARDLAAMQAAVDAACDRRDQAEAKAARIGRSTRRRNQAAA